MLAPLRVHIALLWSGVLLPRASLALVSPRVQRPGGAQKRTGSWPPTGWNMSCISASGLGGGGAVFPNFLFWRGWPWPRPLFTGELSLILTPLLAVCAPSTSSGLSIGSFPANGVPSRGSDARRSSSPGGPQAGRLLLECWLARRVPTSANETQRGAARASRAYAAYIKIAAAGGKHARRGGG